MKIDLNEREEFERVFSQREVPQDIPVYKATSKEIDAVEALSEAGMVASKNEARRLLKQGGISIIDPKDYSQSALKDQKLKIAPEGLILKIGKKKFLKITV